ncbi:MAG: hypothetical protein KatS3mg111_2626 [Pirellulaceae bacterium]|nr:MAG: hypothetical protein KatS3mg111_2626 [Pirellulaceae bacterium]
MFIDPMIPHRLAQKLEDELADGEVLQWSGAPKPVLFDRSSALIWVFAIPWTAFAFFWTGMAFALTRGEEVDASMRLFFPLFGLPFILIGCGMLSVPFWRGRRLRNTVYAITDRRILILRAGKNTIVESVMPREIVKILRVEHADGTGSLRLMTGHVADFVDHTGPLRSQVFNRMLTDGIVIERVGQAKLVERKLQQLIDRVGD